MPEQQEFITREQFGIYQRNPPPRDRYHWNKHQSFQQPPIDSDNLGILIENQIKLLSSRDNHKSKSQNNLKTLNKIQFQRKVKNSQRNIWKQNQKLRLQIYKP